MEIVSKWLIQSENYFENFSSLPSNMQQHVDVVKIKKRSVFYDSMDCVMCT